MSSTTNKTKYPDLTNTDQQLGYVLSSLSTLHSKMDNHATSTNAAIDKLCHRVEKVEHKISTAKTVVATVKFILGALVLILTFKFGAIAGLWGKLFHGP